VVVYTTSMGADLNKKRKSYIEFSDFQKIEIKVGTIINCEAVEGSNKLLKLEVGFGEIGKRQILAGISAWFQPNELVGLQTTFVMNMKPRTIMGLESQGMLLTVDFGEDGKPIVIVY